MTKLEEKIDDVWVEWSVDRTPFKPRFAIIAAKIALDLAWLSYQKGTMDTIDFNNGKENKTFKQFIEDYE